MYIVNEVDDCGVDNHYVFSDDGLWIADFNTEEQAKKFLSVDDLIDAVEGLQILLMRTFDDPTRLQEATAFLAADQALAKARGE